MKMKKYILSIIIIAATLFAGVPVFAEGSKDWYPSGAIGYRAYLVSSTTVTANWPFPNKGVHYVYAKPGETITMASSAQGYGSNASTRWGNRNNIKLYGPDGTEISLTAFTGSQNNNTVFGNISNRTAELAGPAGANQTGGNRYTPVTYTVPPNGEGVYRVEFIGTGTSTSNAATILAK